MVKSTWGVVLLAAAAMSAAAAEEAPAVKLLRSYSQMNYPVARKLAEEHPEICMTAPIRRLKPVRPNLWNSSWIKVFRSVTGCRLGFRWPALLSS